MDFKLGGETARSRQLDESVESSRKDTTSDNATIMRPIVVPEWLSVRSARLIPVDTVYLPSGPSTEEPFLIRAAFSVDSP